jgi:hypothetical protein
MAVPGFAGGHVRGGLRDAVTCGTCNSDLGHGAGILRWGYMAG